MNHVKEVFFETAIEAHLLANGYSHVSCDGYSRERAIFPEVVLDFIRDTQPKEWGKLEALHGEKTGEQIITDLCKWMDANGSLSTINMCFSFFSSIEVIFNFKLLQSAVY